MSMKLKWLLLHYGNSEVLRKNRLMLIALDGINQLHCTPLETLTSHPSFPSAFQSGLHHPLRGLQSAVPDFIWKVCQTKTTKNYTWRESRSVELLNYYWRYVDISKKRYCNYLYYSHPHPYCHIHDDSAIVCTGLL